MANNQPQPQPQPTQSEWERELQKKLQEAIDKNKRPKP